jgi:preprotein translocase subunit YajC
MVPCISAAASAQGKGSGGSFVGSVVPMMLVMFAIIYFLMIRPEQKKQKERQRMISEVKKGDRILTIGGVYGTVGNVKSDSIMVKVAENTVVEIRKTAVSEVLNADKSDKPARTDNRGKK